MSDSMRYETEEQKLGHVHYFTRYSLSDNSSMVLFGRNLGISKRQLICITLLAAGYFFVLCYFALFAPFFPHEAMKKGQSSSHIGAIFGVYQLVLLIGCPIFGKYVIYKLIVIIHMKNDNPKFLQVQSPKTAKNYVPSH